jgi:hypothetical protein
MRCYSAHNHIGRRRIFRSCRLVFPLATFLAEINYPCRFEAGDSSVAVVSINTCETIFISAIKLLRVAPSE